MPSGVNIGNKVSELIMGIILAVVLLLVGVALGPTVVSAVADINATTLADVPLSEVIILLATYVPMFYYLGLVVGALGIIWGYAQIKK